MRFLIFAAGAVAVAAVTQVHGWAAEPAHARVWTVGVIVAATVLSYLLVAWYHARKAKPSAAAPASRPGYTSFGGRGR